MVDAGDWVLGEAGWIAAVGLLGGTGWGFGIELVALLVLVGAMTEPVPNKDPLHGKTLKAILGELVEQLGWEELAARIRINCFAVNPSLNSSLTFLRRTPWARAKVENLYLDVIGFEGPRRGPGTKEEKSLRSRETPRSNRPEERRTRESGAANPWAGFYGRDRG